MSPAKRRQLPVRWPESPHCRGELRIRREPLRKPATCFTVTNGRCWKNASTAAPWPNANMSGESPTWIVASCATATPPAAAVSTNGSMRCKTPTGMWWRFATSRGRCKKDTLIRLMASSASMTRAGERAPSSSFVWQYLFQGGRFEVLTGLYYFRNRDYLPVLGCWIQVDPLGYSVDDLSLRRYEANLPTRLADPLGFQEVLPMPREVPFFKPGDRVRHNSGGPLMNVDSVNGDKITVSWWNGTNFTVQTLDAASLRKVFKQSITDKESEDIEFNVAPSGDTERYKPSGATPKNTTPPAKKNSASPKAKNDDDVRYVPWNEAWMRGPDGSWIPHYPNAVIGPPPQEIPPGKRPGGGIPKTSPPPSTPKKPPER